MNRPHDVITLGRVGVDLYPEQTGVGLAEVRTFAKYLGGTATNVAVAAARYGLRSAVLTGVGDDPFGKYVRSALRGFGVDDAHVVTVPEQQTPVVFCEIFPPDHFPIHFYRRPKAPDQCLTADHLDRSAVREARVLWITGSALAVEPTRSTLLAACEARDRGEGHRGEGDGEVDADVYGETVFDLDYRPSFWADPAEAGPWYARALRHATVAVGNLDEVEVAVGTRDPDRAADLLLERGVRLAVVKQGPRGVLARTQKEEVVVRPVPVVVVNGLGAGDAFGGALCKGLLSGWPLERALTVANAAGALVAGRHACADDMPTLEEVDELLRRHEEAADPSAPVAVPAGGRA
ncbi:5-dehydro-2-deoxygluconokinase [Wenjunlia tyrosinilytica]|uniref:5-dehydro-2-deoxygluconokinase n=1 Tax=Wenjunlia tyrosinilytica TaxID=1544741 RepID=A0A917ZTA6_9ACTN|nr:5-dehydro-2-deoxygluconokinase [Wenjunlia tyrosinilytica]GGO92556.1 5-dehydro-2-deoxygluconokinase [Wenjunlia tyrosinilytica]